MSSQSRCFSRQVEDFCQHLLKKNSIFSPNEAQDVILSVTQTLLSAENHLKIAQEADLKVKLQQFGSTFTLLLITYVFVFGTG